MKDSPIIYPDWDEETQEKLEKILDEKFLNKKLNICYSWGGNTPEDEWSEFDDYTITEIYPSKNHIDLTVENKKRAPYHDLASFTLSYDKLGIDKKEPIKSFENLTLENIQKVLDEKTPDAEDWPHVMEAYYKERFGDSDNVRSWLEKFIVKADDSNNKLGKTYIRGLKKEEKLPRGVYHKASTGTSGILHFNGKDYYWYLDNQDNLHIENHIHDSLDKRFVAESYFDEKLRGLEDKLETNKLDEAKDWIWTKSQKGFITRIIDTETGELWRFDNIEEPEKLDGIKELDFSADQISVWDVVWYDEKGYRHSIEYDSKEMAEEFVAEHPEYREIKILEGIKNLNDSAEEVEISLENMPDKLIEKAYKEYCNCAKKEKFEISSELTKLLNEISKYTKTTETELMQMFKDMFEKETLEVQDSKTLRPLDGENLKRRLRKVLKEYLLSEGFEEDDIDRWLIIDVEDFINEDGDKGVHVQIRNDLIDYYDLPDNVINKLDEIVKPGYFEPYYATVWDAYIWDRILGKSSLEDEDLEDEEDSNKLMKVLKECQEILKRALIREGFDDTGDEIFSKAQFEVRHELDNGKDVIILNGHSDWSGSDLEEEVVNEIKDEIINEYGDCDFTWFDNSAGGIFRFEESRHVGDSVYSHFVSKIRNARSMVELEEVQDLLLKYEENGLVGPNTADELWHEVDLKIDELKQ